MEDTKLQEFDDFRGLFKNVSFILLSSYTAANRYYENTMFSLQHENRLKLPKTIDNEYSEAIQKLLKRLPKEDIQFLNMKYENNYDIVPNLPSVINDLSMNDMKNSYNLFLSWFVILGSTALFTSLIFDDEAKRVILEKLTSLVFHIRPETNKPSSTRVRNVQNMTLFMDDQGSLIISHPDDPTQTISLDESCPICFTDWIDNPEITRAPSVLCFSTSEKECQKHAFHCQCLNRWIAGGIYTCPMCRESITSPIEVIPSSNQ